MHFITEFELRASYKKHPFTSFDLKPNIRLTPEAKQFLLDRKIKIINWPIIDKHNIDTKINLSGAMNSDKFLALALKVAIEEVDITVCKLITCNCLPCLTYSRQSLYDEWYKIKSNLIAGESEEIKLYKSFEVSEFSLIDYVVEGKNSEIIICLGEFRIKLMNTCLLLTKISEEWVKSNITSILQLIHSIEACIKLISQEI